MLTIVGFFKRFKPRLVKEDDREKVDLKNQLAFY